MQGAQPVPFVVGRIARDGKRMIVLESATPAPFPGPWDLRAVFAAGASRPGA
ncbi:MAG TPA: hypothetical protein VF263_11915 [Longimicrobiaceae bacterium]